MPAPEPGPIRLVVQALVHATEVEAMVRTAIHNLFSETVSAALQFQRIRLQGHFHNPIIRLVVTLENRELINQTLHSLGNRLSPRDRELLHRNLPSHVDEKGQLFLRFDKQESFQGRLRLIDRGDSLRVAIKFTAALRDPSVLHTYLQKCCLI